MIDMNLEAVNSALAATVRKQEEEIKAADAEIKRLRAALKGFIGAVADHTSRQSIPEALKNARSALTAQSAEGEKHE